MDILRTALEKILDTYDNRKHMFYLFIKQFSSLTSWWRGKWQVQIVQLIDTVQLIVNSNRNSTYNPRHLHHLHLTKPEKFEVLHLIFFLHCWTNEIYFRSSHYLEREQEGQWEYSFHFDQSYESDFFVLTQSTGKILNKLHHMIYWIKITIRLQQWLPNFFASSTRKYSFNFCWFWIWLHRELIVWWKLMWYSKLRHKNLLADIKFES